jgi:hypothetical protein
VFQTANKVLLVSKLVAVVTAVTAGPPAVSDQPPKLYPVRVVETTWVRASVVRVSESAGALVDVPLAGTELAKTLPLKTMVGFVGVDAKAGAPKLKMPVRARDKTAETVRDFLLNCLANIVLTLLAP